MGLINRRLAIVDLSDAAAQPMCLRERGLWLTFNGEIHNYLELRRELEGRGARFRSATDTEVVLWAYAVWGDHCFDRFNGMWALGLWDAPREQLVLCRDRFGIKPLVLSVRGDRVCFASEPKAILAAFGEEAEPDRAEIDRFLAGGFPDASRATFFRGIENVRAGSCLVISRSAVREHRYWSFEPGTEARRPDAEERFRELLRDAVALRMRSDVPVGVCVSGGLDSSSVVRLLDRGRERLHAFSTRYEDPGYDESAYAAIAAGEDRVQMHWVQPEPDGMLDTMRRIVWHHDAPTPMRGRYAQWFVMREAGRHVKVVLVGEGGDELLAGYPRDALSYLADRLAQCRHGAASWQDTAREARELAAMDGSARWFALTAPRRYLRDPRAHGPTPYRSRLNNVLWDGLVRHGLPEILHSEDALSMAFSVEARTPFLDHRLVELCFSLPFDEKMSGGWSKSLLRRSMAGIVPAEILARRGKYGFLAPIGPWITLERNRRAVEELLLDRACRERGVLDPVRLGLGLTALYRGPSRFTTLQALRVWRWITLELWFRQFIDRRWP